MQNCSGANYFIVDINGEIMDTIKNGDEYIIKTKERVERDANYVYNATEKIDVNFTKFVENNVFRLLQNNKSLALPLLALSHRIQPKTNILILKGKRYGATHLAQDLNVSRQMAHRYIKKLKELNVIKNLSFNKKQFLVVNPYLFHKGDRLMLATKIAFKENQWQG
jgi:predicted transcriptional regulator